MIELTPTFGSQVNEQRGFYQASSNGRVALFLRVRRRASLASEERLMLKVHHGGRGSDSAHSKGEDYQGEHVGWEQQ